MTKRRQSLSVTVITKNEEDRLGSCLDSVQELADEIIVLDSGSTDHTVDVARRYTDQVWVTDWPGYGPQKQRALEKATGDWVLAIDADEVLTPELQQEIAAMLDGDRREVAYCLPWAVTIFGKRLDHGRSARAPLRLFRREGARFTDAQVHETVLLPPGKVGTMKGRLLHFTHRHFGETLYKNAHYAWLGARQRHESGKKGGGLVGATARGILVFLQVYILRGGFLDGSVGFLMAVMYSQVAFNKYAGLWTLQRQDRLQGKTQDR
ncbi:MAG: glycosyltransferase family 2 protein [Desulfuromonadales bacterium]|uniref:glycosyltransferase family 2 protein n=1 Tax=Desulfuromonas sp. KJ2020 TaxID=2919173 RepID=UPI0020A6DE7D|nr:glycosyltransferase family 2 protein [Desulfuromonas sp. KJ2020]MCP3177549.1 glycosyltransferase family 2 protein [Desulfuromonas sp. KJ2020]